MTNHGKQTAAQMVKKFPAVSPFMGTKRSLQCSQQPSLDTTQSQLNPVHSFTPSLRTIYITTLSYTPWWKYDFPVPVCRKRAEYCRINCKAMIIKSSNCLYLARPHKSFGSFSSFVFSYTTRRSWSRSESSLGESQRRKGKRPSFVIFAIKNIMPFNLEKKTDRLLCINPAPIILAANLLMFRHYIAAGHLETSWRLALQQRRTTQK